MILRNPRSFGRLWLLRDGGNAGRFAARPEGGASGPAQVVGDCRARHADRVAYVRQGHAAPVGVKDVADVEIEGSRSAALALCHALILLRRFRLSMRPEPAPEGEKRQGEREHGHESAVGQSRHEPRAEPERGYAPILTRLAALNKQTFEFS